MERKGGASAGDGAPREIALRGLTGGTGRVVSLALSSLSPSTLPGAAAPLLHSPLRRNFIFLPCIPRVNLRSGVWSLVFHPITNQLLTTYIVARQKPFRGARTSGAPSAEHAAAPWLREGAGSRV